MCSRLVHNAVSTIFDFPNPLPPLAPARRAPKQRATDLSTTPPSDTSSAGVPPPDKIFSPIPARPDHTYQVSSVNAHGDDGGNAILQEIPCRAQSSTVRRKILTENEKRLHAILLRQRVKICRLRKKVAKLQSSNQQTAFGFTLAVLNYIVNMQFI